MTGTAYIHIWNEKKVWEFPLSDIEAEGDILRKVDRILNTPKSHAVAENAAAMWNILKYAKTAERSKVMGYLQRAEKIREQLRFAAMAMDIFFADQSETNRAYALDILEAVTL